MIRVHLNPNALHFDDEREYIDVEGATQIATDDGVLALFRASARGVDDDPIAVFAPGVWVRTERIEPKAEAN